MAGYEGHGNFASKGMAGAGLGLGIAGTALGLGFLNGGWGRPGGFFGGPGPAPLPGGIPCGCAQRGPLVDRFELIEAQKIAALESQNAFLRAEIDIQRKFGIAETQIAHLQDAVCCLKNELCQTNQRISQITATVIPSTVVWTPPAGVTTPEGGGTTVS